MFLNNLDYQVMIGQRAFRASFSKGPAGPGEYGLVQVACTRQTSQAPAGARNMQIVMFLCDITLYHLASWLPQKMGYEVREIRYRRAIEWLQGVQSGKIVPDLDTPDDSNGEPQPYNLTWGSEQHSNYIW